METKIESDIPVPGTGWYEDLIKLNVGDSFEFPEGNYSGLREKVAMVRKKHPKRRFTTRANGNKTRRVWRIR